MMPEGALLTPPMPADWTLAQDNTFPAEKVDMIEGRLGVACIVGLRNTVFDVGGLRVQLNTVAAADEAGAASVHAALAKMKSEGMLLKKGRLVFEFVAADDALPAIAAGRAHLERQGP